MSSIDQPSDLPKGTIWLVWAEYRQWAEMARTLKARQKRARLIAALSGLAGAFFGALSGATFVEDDFKRLSAGGGALFLLIATYWGREVIKPERELFWARARSLAEALKRETWLSLLRVPPYEAEDAPARLQKRAEELRLNTGLERRESNTAETARGELPKAESVSDYLELRLKDQIEWYGRRADEYLRTVVRWNRIALGLGLLAAILGGWRVLPVDAPAVAVWIPVITTATAAVAAYLHAGRFEPLIGAYQDTQRQLRYRLALWEDLPAEQKTREKQGQFIRDCEDIMAAENEAWRTEWMTGKKDEEAGQPTKARES